MEVPANETGIVKVFYSLKGYGFITRPKGRDAFFHYSDIVTEGTDSVVLEGDKVTYYIVESPSRPRAKNVTKAG